MPKGTDLKIISVAKLSTVNNGLKVAEELIEKGFDGSDVAKMKGEVNTNS